MAESTAGWLRAQRGWLRASAGWLSACRKESSAVYAAAVPDDPVAADDSVVDVFSPVADELLANNAEYARTFEFGGLPAHPKHRLAVVACLDSRLMITAILGLAAGDAHIIRNAGGVVTDDVIRSLCFSQHQLGTREIILMHHSDCGLSKVSEKDFKSALAEEVGVCPPWSLESFHDPCADVCKSMQRLLRSPYILHKAHIRGFVYDLTSGLLDEVTLDQVDPEIDQINPEIDQINPEID